jgi:hypothetical protein
MTISNQPHATWHDSVWHRALLRLSLVLTLPLRPLVPPGTAKSNPKLHVV